MEAALRTRIPQIMLETAEVTFCVRGVISPLRSNVYLTEVDGMLERAKVVTHHQQWTYVEYARFADDLVVLVDAHPRQRWLRTAVDTGLLSFLLVIWFFISFIGPGLNWPDATLRLSAFYYYGTPLLHGLPLLDTLGVLAVTVAALAVASVRFVRKDIGR